MKALSGAVVWTCLVLGGCQTRVLDLGGDRGAGGDSDMLDAGARIFLGGNSTCARRADGVVKCWGLNDRGQLAVETEHECGSLRCSSVPTTAPVLEGAGLLALGRRFGCASDAEGEVSCWGENSFGELGRGGHDEDAHLEPRSAGVGDVSALFAGSHHACALTSQGAVLCWGLGHDGQLALDPAELGRCAVPAEQRGVAGVPSASDAACATEPTEVPSFAGAVELALGDQHTCARFEDGRVLCAGRGDAGQLGHGDVTGGFEPVESLTTGADAIASGAQHSCAVVGGTVRCWGSDARGQLGVGSTAHEMCGADPCLLSPTRLGDLPDADALALGGYFSCARLVDGRVRCWGDDSSGQLGNSSFAGDTCETSSDGTFDCLKRPLADAYDLHDVLELRAGASHACALLESELRCWGSSESGQASGHEGAVTFPSLVYGLN